MRPTTLILALSLPFLRISALKITSPPSSVTTISIFSPLNVEWDYNPSNDPDTITIALVVYDYPANTTSNTVAWWPSSTAAGRDSFDLRTQTNLIDETCIILVHDPLENTTLDSTAPFELVGSIPTEDIDSDDIQNPIQDPPDSTSARGITTTITTTETTVYPTSASSSYSVASDSDTITPPSPPTSPSSSTSNGNSLTPPLNVKIKGAPSPVPLTFSLYLYGVLSGLLIVIRATELFCRTWGWGWWREGERALAQRSLRLRV